MKRPKIDIDGIWMSVRYCLSRNSIAAIGRATDIVTWYHKDLSVEDKLGISQDIEDFIRQDVEVHDNWYKVMKAFNVKWHVALLLTTGETKTCFEHKGRYYALETYLEFPYKEITVNEEYIVK